MIGWVKGFFWGDAEAEFSEGTKVIMYGMSFLTFTVCMLAWMVN